MKLLTNQYLSIIVCGLALASCSSENTDHASSEMIQTNDAVCEGFGPQTPRDIDQVSGTNPITFALAPDAKELNLCNIHFHNNAEHKAEDFSLYAGEGHDGHGGGYQCSSTRR